MSGVVAVESKNDGSMANGIGSTKRLPIESATKLVIAGTNCIRHSKNHEYHNHVKAMKRKQSSRSCREAAKVQCANKHLMSPYQAGGA